MRCVQEPSSDCDLDAIREALQRLTTFYGKLSRSIYLLARDNPDLREIACSLLPLFIELVSFISGDGEVFRDGLDLGSIPTATAEEANHWTRTGLTNLNLYLGLLNNLCSSD